MASHACHIEILQDVSTDSFIQCFMHSRLVAESAVAVCIAIKEQFLKVVITVIFKK